MSCCYLRVNFTSANGIGISVAIHSRKKPFDNPRGRTMSPSVALAVESGFVAAGVTAWIVVTIQSFVIMMSWIGVGL